MIPAQTPGTGLSVPSVVPSVMGILPIRSLAQLAAEERTEATQRNNQSYIQSIVSHIRRCWTDAKMAKLQTIEPRLLQCLRQRRGEYDPEKLAEIKAQGLPEIYMFLSSNKARAASSWLKDVEMGSGSEKPWALEPSPITELPPDIVEEKFAELEQELAQYAAVGITLAPSQLRSLVLMRREMALNEIQDYAKQRVERMERKMEDQLAEGGFPEAFTAFLDDLVTFPSAFMKGPVIRRRKKLSWKSNAQGGWDAVVEEKLVKEWERVDPFRMYPSPAATTTEDGYLIEHHRLSRGAIEALKGVDGYDEGAINAVLDEYSQGRLSEWMWIDAQKTVAEGKSLSVVMQNSENLIDALQFWGPVQGKMLRDWGLSEEEVPDPFKEYEVEAWLVDRWVIKATLNPDPTGKRGYYKASYEEVPGAFWGNSVMDLIRDCQDVCNAAARALVSNMGIASGPQVWVNIDRLPQGEQITQMYPWKIWQTTSDPMGATSPPVDFFQPNAMTAELMAVYERFAVLADEYSGVPRYMTGDSPTGGAGRTASGMSMLMNNAGKAIKQVVSNVDKVLKQLLTRLYTFNMLWEEDPDLKGDINIVVRGAASLMAKEGAAQRRNEFLQVALNNPMARQVVGMEGVAQLLREQVKTLDMNPDRVVPPPEVVRVRDAMMQIQALQMQAQQPQQAPQQPAGPTGSGQELANGEPVTDNFSPMKQS